MAMDGEESLTADEIRVKKTKTGDIVRKLIELLQESKTRNGHELLRWAKMQKGWKWTFIFDELYTKNAKRYMEFVEMAVQYLHEESRTWSWKETLENFNNNKQISF